MVKWLLYRKCTREWGNNILYVLKRCIFTEKSNFTVYFCHSSFTENFCGFLFCWFFFYSGFFQYNLSSMDLIWFNLKNEGCSNWSFFNEIWERSPNSKESSPKNGLALPWHQQDKEGQNNQISSKVEGFMQFITLFGLNNNNRNK